MAGTWLTCIESAGIYDSYGVVQRDWADSRERLGHGQAILGCHAWKGGGYPVRGERLSGWPGRAFICWDNGQSA